jgi:hypothetical protein
MFSSVDALKFARKSIQSQFGPLFYPTTHLQWGRKRSGSLSRRSSFVRPDANAKRHPMETISNQFILEVAGGALYDRAYLAARAAPTSGRISRNLHLRRHTRHFLFFTQVHWEFLTKVSTMGKVSEL